MARNNVAFDYSNKVQSAALQSAKYGLISTASMMIGVSSVKTDVKSMIITAFAGLVAGACRMAIGEFIYVSLLVDMRVAQRRRDDADAGGAGLREANLPSPLRAAVASALPFSVGGTVPLLAAGFITSFWLRLGVVCAVVTLALLAFGFTEAKLGGVSVGRSTARFLIGGWMAMGLSYWLTSIVDGILL